MRNRLWPRQIFTVASIEIRKRLFGRRALLLYGLAGMPVFVMGLYALFVTESFDSQLAGEVVFAATYRAAILRLVVFFGCVAVFSSLFRGEILERTLHYYFLSPVRRPVIVLGKYFAGLIATFLLFGASTALSWSLAHARSGGSFALGELLAGPRLSQLGSYILVTALACIGYGAVFLAIGIVFRSPILPAIAILTWEHMNALLPPALKKISVIHYLESLCPVPLPTEKIAILADPSPAWVSVPGLLLLAAVLLAVSAVLSRRSEILYGSE